MFQLTCAPLAMNPLKFDFGNIFFNIISLRFDLLNFGVLELHVTNYNGHHFTISKIVYMTSHSCPTSNTLHMIKHDPSILQIPYRLHSCDQVRSILHIVYKHLENENLLSYNLSWKVTLLNVFIAILEL